MLINSTSSHIHPVTTTRCTNTFRLSFEVFSAYPSVDDCTHPSSRLQEGATKATNTTNAPRVCFVLFFPKCTHYICEYFNMQHTPNYSRNKKKKNPKEKCKIRNQVVHFKCNNISSPHTTVSTVSPGPNPKSTPHSSPSPVVLSPSSADFLLISSKMNSTQALDMLPYSASTCLVARSFSGFRANLASTWSKMAGPPG
ncbi:hypothetical protein RJ641_003708 [Dillenia turbinata]|uniref:Uncharacterized protein n=1 Tax=Dillenia turbinata TaxID=194707 RepID=A0AAN8VDH7_9MAGN